MKIRLICIYIRGDEWKGELEGDFNARNVICANLIMKLDYFV